MSESAKKRKSLWDSKEETPLPDHISQKNAWHGKENYSSLHGSRDPKWSDVQANNVLKSEDCLDVRYRRSRGRGRDRSRSRSRGRGRSRSRSRSRSWSRGRGRARSRSRSRSPNPLGDHRLESYGWSDRRRSGMGVSPQPCRDFAAGKCRRGSHCRFLHQDFLNHQDGERLENDQIERWRGSRNSSVDHDYKRQPKNSNIPCKFFMMGKCQRDNCRFSHDGPEGGNLEGKSQAGRRGHDFDNTNTSWNGPKWGEATAVTDIAQSTGRGNVGKGIFVDPTTAERQSDDRWDHSLDDKTKLRNHPKWGDATAALEIAKSTGWAKSSVENVNLTDPMNAEKYADDRRDHGLDNESRMWGGAVGEDKTAERDETVSLHWLSGSQVSMGISDSKDVAESFNKEKPPLILHGLQSQTLHGIDEKVHEQNIMQEVSGRQQLATTVMHPIVSESSQIQQQHNKIGDNIVMTDDSNLVNRVGIYGNAGHPILIPGQNFNQNVDSFGSQPPIFGGISQSQHTIFMNPSNEHNIDSNGPVQQNSPSDLQNQTQIPHERSVKTLVNSGIPQNVMNSEQAVHTSFPASLTQIFGNGQLPQLYAALNPPKFAELVCSLPDSAGLPPSIASTDAQPDPATMSQKQYDPIGDSIEPNKVNICNQPPQFSSLERSSPSSAVGLDSGKLLKDGCPEDDFHRNPELKQEKPVTNLVVEEVSKSIAEKCKQDQENIHAGNVDADGKVGDGTNGKDEKAMRLFKIALVEFVKEILKPKWKEGQMSREVHKSIVKKVVDKVTSTIQGVNIPKTQDKIDQYLSYSKPKLTKLVEAYTERFLKSS